MKLFLSSTSEALPLISKLLPKKGKGAKVLFSENASDMIPGDHFWVTNDKKAFKKIGCSVVETDLRKLSKAEFTKLLKASDIIHFCGGSTAYLISLLQKNGFGTLISKSVQQGKIIYSGTSAGSMISADSLKLITLDKDKDERKFIRQMKSSNGLGLVNFLLVPHCNQADFIGYAQSLVGHLPKNPQSLILIHDKQAVAVVDGVNVILSRTT